VKGTSLEWDEVSVKERGEVGQRGAHNCFYQPEKEQHGRSLESATTCMCSYVQLEGAPTLTFCRLHSTNYRWVMHTPTGTASTRNGGSLGRV
jgi:hypothetical protein